MSTSTFPNVSQRDYPLIVAMHTLTEKIRDGKLTVEQKDALLDTLQPFLEETHRAAKCPSSEVVDLDTKLTWKYLLYGWALSQFIDESEKPQSANTESSTPSSGLFDI